MKICLILMCAFSFGLSATTHAQQERINLNLKEVTLKTLLDEIQQQTRLHFMVNREQTERLGLISVHVKNETVEKVLEDVFRDTRLTCKFMDGIIVVKEREVQAQTGMVEIVVSGQVTDERKQPLPVVTVMIKGGIPGTVTDAEGHFTFKVPEIKDLVLVFSFIGMKTTEIRYAGQKDLKVVMAEEVAEIGEVVVTGIFSKPKESYTGAVTPITAKELQKVGNRNILTSIRNIDPSFNITEDINIGSDPNKLPNITVRGNSSLDVNMKDLQTDSRNRQSPNLPLFIMDGFEITLERMMDLDENQVESITLLKDASATAMYGTRGANGVVVITTRKPEPGQLRITYKGSLNIEAPDLTSYNLMNASEKLAYEKAAGLYEYARADDEQGLIELYNYRLKEVKRGVNTYWLKYPVRTGIGHRHSLRLEGGREEFRYAAGLSCNRVAGTMKGSDRNTFNGNVFLSYKYKNITSRMIYRSLSISRKILLMALLMILQRSIPTGNLTTGKEIC